MDEGAETRRYALQEGLETYPTGEELVAFRPGRDEVHRLNATAARVLERCDGRELAAIAGEIARLFPDVPADTIRADVERLLPELVAKGLVIELAPEDPRAGN